MQLTKGAVAALCAATKDTTPVLQLLKLKEVKDKMT